MGFLSNWLPVVLWMGTIFYISSIPSHRMPPMRFAFGDKVAHACAYAAGGFLVARAVLHPVPTILVPVAFGASDEWHQRSVPGRESDVADWIADCIGAIIGIAAYRRYLSSRTPSKRLARKFP